MCVYAMTVSLVCDPVLSVRLIGMGMPEDNTGYAFGVLGIATAAGAPLAGWLGTKFPIRYIQQFGVTLLTLGFFFVGPSLWFGGLPDKIWVIFIGLFIMGGCVAFMYVLVTPEIIEASG